MRIGVIAVVALSLACGSCGGFVPVVTPLAEASDDLAEGMGGRLILGDGGRLEMRDGRMLGDWFCGMTRVGPGVLPEGQQGVCIPPTRIAAVETDEWKAGPADWIGQVITVVIMWPIILIWGHSKNEERKRSEASAVEAAEAREIAEAEAAERGEVLPPLPTAQSRGRVAAFRSLANCARVDHHETDGQTLAAQVWRDREHCLAYAAEWFLANGEMARARHLSFTELARRRYEALLCGEEEPGLYPPQKTFIDAGAARTWMGEYRAVVADSRTYEYEAQPDCESGAEAGGLVPRVQARRLAVAGFPLTDPAVLQAAIAWQADRS